MTKKIAVNIKPGSAGTEVFVDGEKISGLRGITVRAAVGEPSSAIMEFVGVEIDLSGDVAIVADRDRDFPNE